MAGANHNFNVGFQEKSLNFLLNERETVLMFTSLLLECRMVCTFLQELIGERIDAHPMLWSSLAEVLRGCPLRFYSHKISFVEFMGAQTNLEIRKKYKMNLIINNDPNKTLQFVEYIYGTIDIINV